MSVSTHLSSQPSSALSASTAGNNQVQLLPTTLASVEEDRLHSNPSPSCLSESSDMLSYDPPKTSSISPSIATTALQSRSVSPVYTIPGVSAGGHDAGQLWQHGSSIKSGGAIGIGQVSKPSGSGLRRTDTGESNITLVQEEEDADDNGDDIIIRVRGRKSLRPMRAPSSASSQMLVRQKITDDSNKENIDPISNNSQDQVESVVFKFVVSESASTRIQLTNRPEELLARCISRRRAARLNGEPIISTTTAAGNKRAYPFGMDGQVRKRRSRSVNERSWDGDDEEMSMKPYPVTESLYYDYAKDALNITLPLNYNPLQSLGATTRRIASVCRYQTDQNDYDLPYYGEEEYDDEDDDDEMSDCFGGKSKKKKSSSTAKPKRTRSKEAKIHAEKFCASCKTNQTPIWREVKESWGEGWQEVMLCNACGLQWRMAGLRCSECHYVPRASEKKSKKCTRCDAGVWYRK